MLHIFRKKTNEKVKNHNKKELKPNGELELRIEEASKSKFIQDKEYVLSYLKSKGVKEEFYFDLIKNNDFGYLEDNIMIIDTDELYGGEFRLEAFFTYAPGDYDIRECNKYLEKAAKELKMEYGPGIAIASMAGGDTVCLNTDTGEVYLWLLETGVWEKIHAANSVKEFVEMIKYV